MGIKNLTEFLRNKFPQIFKTVHISEYHYKKVAIDISLYMNVFIHRFARRTSKPGSKVVVECRKQDWIPGFIDLVATLRKNEVHCIFIYDTKAPVEKTVEREKRTASKDKMENTSQELQDSLDNYYETKEISKFLLDFQERRNLGQKSLISNNNLNIKGIELALETMLKNLVRPTKADYEISKKLFDLLDIPYLDAFMEAETLCCDLCIQGEVDAVLSKDTDVLAYGAPIFLTDINTKSETCTKIEYKDLLNEMELTSDEFLDFCIMCGTDYNDNIPKVGPVKAYALIKQYGSIEHIGRQTGLNISILNHKRVREMFRNYPKYTKKISYCGIPKFSELEQFLFKNNVRIDHDYLESSFVRKFIIEDEIENEIENEEDIIIED